MILQPNQRRRTRIFRASAGIVALLFLGALVASGWTLPAISLTADATPSAEPAPTATPALPSLAAPTPSPTTPMSSPSPSSSPIPGGCTPPPDGLTPAIVVSHGARTGRRVALTFDDGTNPYNVLRILRVLRSEHVNATFFPTGRSVQLFPDVWRRVAAAGYPIANHTYGHPSLAGMCYEDQMGELLHDQRVLGTLGLTMLPVMRPPYEEFDQATRFATSAVGESHVVLWDVDTRDWTGISSGAIFRSATAGKSGSIVLMHTSPINTAYALRKIIHRYRARGFTFVTIGTMLGVPGSVPFP